MNTDIEFLKKLIAIPSVSDDVAQVNKAEDCMREYLEAHGVACVTEECDGRKVLYASTLPGKVQDFLLNAHLDVVPGPARLFEPVIEGDILRARGAEDCKGSAVAIAQVLCELNGKASVGAIFTADEEIGGSTTAYMVDKGYAARKLVVVVDGSEYAIVSAEKGVVDLILKAKGKNAHSSAPWVGVNAIDILLDGYAKLRAAWPKNAPGPDGDVWFDTMSADIISGGTAHNKVPDEAELLVNIRFIKPGDEDRIEKFVRETTGLEVSRGEVSIPVFCDEKTPALQDLKAAMERTWPDKKIGFTRMCGATDARHFARASAPIAITGVHGAGCHTDDEWVQISCVGELASMLIDYALKA